ncbi:MAG TPA: iron-sulfur cluster biosynthesis family protein [Nitrospiraceae bacterium]|jgi:Fe-S cluster assembly iron-binding protein IscA|nr:iron-sulfur cluster biosynthesis family protein [Nitrospiraceae bacterium]
MITLTLTAIAQLKAIQAHHPEDPFVRISVRDLDDSRLSFSITLEANTEPDDDIQHIESLTIVVDRRSAARMEGVTVDYTEAAGFRFLHDGEGRALPLLTIPTLN